MERNKRCLSLDQLKCYFDVTNDYVLQKLRVVLFPFTVKGEDGWRRRELDIAQGVDTEQERDLQAPDLYIPLMAFVTFILLVGAKYGQNDT